eukprot:66996_1
MPPNNIKEARNPTVEGVVVLAPGTNDLNTCFTADGHDGGGFYIQDSNGAGIWVCPVINSLINGVNYGDNVRVTGSLMNNKVSVFLLKATSITVINSNGQEVISPLTYDSFQNNGLAYSTLVSYAGYVSKLWLEDVGAGLAITDCDGNVIKGWWTAIPDVDVIDLFYLDAGFSGTPNWQDSYFEMIGFYEVYNPVCQTWGGSEFQPRLENIKKIDNPCQ